jgi:cyclophilin family peptidyl-prolyl cis-trans isomerase
MLRHTLMIVATLSFTGLVVAAEPLPQVVLETSKGPVTLELYEDEAPNTVANFISLVEKGFYDGLLFHRVLDGFMAQGGDPKGNGTGGPGYSIACECYRKDHRKHDRGVIAMAHAGKDTGGSQFYITFVPTPHLDGKHTVFGRVIEGMDAVDALNRSGSGKKPDVIKKATVKSKRDHEYKPVTVAD